ncbi:hypothetical protein JCGZ_25477 [Jatropha curcas]|uniref:Uncharacterized protein n=1 Tax=Jatropha curcas TaxID=180498 RepID=A0A067JZ00_JATCU|nr:hypothetical protein JCGZ_25477 [Jatropha curcas]
MRDSLSSPSPSRFRQLFSKMKLVIDSSGDAGHGSNLPSLRSDLQRRESRPSPMTVTLFDLRRFLAISDGLKVNRRSRSTPLLHMNIFPPLICDFACVLMNHHGRRLKGGCGGRSDQTSH